MNDFLAPNIWPEEMWREPSRALDAASLDQRRRVATRAGEIAIAHRALGFPEALAALRAGELGDCELRSAAWAPVLYFALSANPDEAAGNALYEARQALDHDGAATLVAMIEDELRR